MFLQATPWPPKRAADFWAHPPRRDARSWAAGLAALFLLAVAAVMAVTPARAAEVAARDTAAAPAARPAAAPPAPSRPPVRSFDPFLVDDRHAARAAGAPGAAPADRPGSGADAGTLAQTGLVLLLLLLVGLVDVHLEKDAHKLPRPATVTPKLRALLRRLARLPA